MVDEQVVAATTETAEPRPLQQVQFPWWRRQLVLIVLILLAIGLRLWYLHINPLTPQFSNADDGDYYRRALRLAVTGNYVDDAWLIRPPFHVLIFAGVIKAALLADAAPAVGIQLIQLLQALLGALMVPVCYGLGSRLFNRRAGLIFAAFWTLWFPFVELPATLFSEPIYLLMWALHLWLLLRYTTTKRLWDLVLSGIVLGMAALTRSPALYALVFTIPWFFVLAWRSSAARATSSHVGWWQMGVAALRRSWRPFAVLVVATLIVVLPWTARNWIVYHRVIAIDTLGPINLWLDLGATDQRDAKINALSALPQADRQAYAMKQAMVILRADPLKPFRSMWSTFRHIWKAQYVEDYFLKTSFFTRPLREAAPLGLFGDVLWLVFVFAGVIGVLHPATDEPFKIVLLLWLVYSILTVLIFHVEPRYLLPIWFLLGWYGAGLLALRGPAWRIWQQHRLRAIGSAVVIIALAYVFISYRDYPTLLARGFRREAAMRDGDAAYRAGDFQRAEGLYREAIAVDPSFSDADVSLAMTLAAEGRPKDGLQGLDTRASRRSGLIAGILHRMVGDYDDARSLLSVSEDRSGEDTQLWTLDEVQVESRSSLTIGDDALDLGYIHGFAGSEQSGVGPMRWLEGTGVIILPLPAALAPGSEVALDLAAPLPLTRPLTVVAGSSRMEIMPSPQWRTYHLVLPPELVGSRQLRIEFHAPITIPARANPQSDDSRPLSVMVHRVEVMNRAR